MPDPITLRHLGPDDLDLLLSVQDGLFDNPILSDQARAFLDDPLHEMVLAIAGGQAVGMASGMVMYHPDKPPMFFIAEVGVVEPFQRRGIATQLCTELRAVAEARGCAGVWVATEGDNVPARGLYTALGARETEGVVVYDWDDRAMDGGA
ncbi:MULTISPECIES: GNAT family N-acetyltransferase [unclassified Yoonia]|uniref:GNAT family N-acetyltransferase n=1 Tax=unclassified Yoonia TaxID=2629118 RepID=UPI002AFE91E2|nr:MULTISPECIES: GNAT family N-acetyltransferase [unclassified Yoonia]